MSVKYETIEYIKKHKKLNNIVKRQYRKYSQSEIILFNISDILINKFNIKYGDTIIVHTSFKHIRKSDFEPEDLIFLLQMIVGSEGNIIMPSFRKSKDFIQQKKFYESKSFGYSGLTNEIFRMNFNVKRSLHPWKSCVVWGKDADYLIRDHWKSTKAFDENSPFYKAKLLNGKYVGIGCGFDNCSFIHTIDDTHTELFGKIYDDPIMQDIVCANGDIISHEYSLISKKWMNLHRFWRIRKYLEKAYCKEVMFKTIPFSCADLSPFYKKMVELAQKGNSIYGDNLALRDKEKENKVSTK